MRTLSPSLRRNLLRRVAQEDTQPGDVSPPLKRRMREDDIVEMFEESGRSLFKKVVEELKDVLRDSFNEAIPELDQRLKDEGGRRWQKAASEFYRPWINDMVETIVTQGMNEAAGALEDVASSYAAEQSAPDDEEDEGDELIEVPKEEVEEVEDVEPAEEEEGEEDMELEELLAADALPRTITRPKRHRRRVQADERRLPPSREPRRTTPAWLHARKEGKRPFDKNAAVGDPGARDLAYEAASWLRNVKGMFVDPVEGVHGEQFWIDVKSPAGYGDERDTAHDVAKRSLEKIGATYDQELRSDGLVYWVYKMPADLPDVVYATVAQMEDSDPTDPVSLTFYEEDMLCIYEPC